MKAGKLDRRIRLEKPGTPTDDGYGGGLPTWDIVATVWAQFLPSLGSEKRAAGQAVATVPVIFRIRHSSTVAAIDETWRIVFDGKAYDVKSALPIGRNVGIEIAAIWAATPAQGVGG